MFSSVALAAFAAFATLGVESGPTAEELEAYLKLHSGPDPELASTEDDTADQQHRASDLAAARGKTALVTGAAGFVGSHVAAHCRDLGMKVVALDDLSGGFSANLPKGVTFVEGDIKNATLLDIIFTEHNIDFVYHLAAYAAEGLSHFIRSFNYRTNLVGSVEVLNMAVKHKVKCFVFTSSIAVYGSINDLSQMQNPDRALSTSGHKPKESGEAKGLTEEDHPTPEDPYGIAKYAFELDLHAAKGLFGMDYVVFRPHNVYGPHQNMFDKYRNVVGIFINQIHHGEPMTVFGNGEQIRAFSYIDDVAPVIARGPLVQSARNQVFNVGADRPYTVNDLVKEVSTAMDSENHAVSKQPARMEVDTAVSNHQKVKDHFRTGETVGLTEGLQRTVAWYKDTGKYFQPVEFQSVEVKKGMPPSWLRRDLKETAICEGSRIRAVETAPDSLPIGETHPATETCVESRGEHGEVIVTTGLPTKPKAPSPKPPRRKTPIAPEEIVRTKKPTVSCKDRMPAIGDEVVYAEGRLTEAHDTRGEMSWQLFPRESATVVEVDKDGDFRLRNPSGLESDFILRKFYNFKDV